MIEEAKRTINTIRAATVALSVVAACFVVVTVLLVGAGATNNISLLRSTALLTAVLSVGFTVVGSLVGGYFVIRTIIRAREDVYQAMIASRTSSTVREEGREKGWREEIENRIRTRVGEDPRTRNIPPLDVEVTEGGMIIVRGEVYSEEQKEAVSQIAFSVGGAAGLGRLWPEGHLFPVIISVSSPTETEETHGDEPGASPP